MAPGDTCHNARIPQGTPIDNGQKGKNMVNEKRNLTVMETAKYLGIGRRAAYELVNSEGFPSFRVGAKILVNVERLESWIQQNIEKNWERD